MQLQTIFVSSVFKCQTEGDARCPSSEVSPGVNLNIDRNFE